MLERLTDAVRRVLVLAQAQARSLNQSFLSLRESLHRPERERQDRISNARDLREVRTAARMTVEELAVTSNIEVERLREAESAKPEDDLTFAEWKRLAVVLEGHTLDEYHAQTAKMGNAGWVADSGHRLEGMRRLVRHYFPQDDHEPEDD